jgi:hypothetical protein
MGKLRPFCIVFMLPVFVALALLPGCDSGAVVPKGKKRLASSADETEVPRVGVAAAQYGNITGKVVYDGTPPTPQPIPMGPAAAQCHAAPPNQVENDEEKWLVDPATKGVKNVIVFLQPPEGKFFDIPEAQQKPKADVEITQPRCAFMPRAFVLFPSFYDKATNSEKPTGQKLVILNDAPFEHNYNLVPGSDENRGSSRILKRGESQVMDNLHPQSKPITLKCDIHSWMRSYGFILEHPYAAITKDDGTFTIENAPLGVPLRVVGWHEAINFFNGGEEGTAKTLQANEALSFKIKSR